MIVSCPSCRTRYRHPGPENPARTACCSRCDERFPLVGKRPGFVVLPARDLLAAATPAGMDDPSLAASIDLPAAEPFFEPAAGAAAPEQAAAQISEESYAEAEGYPAPESGEAAEAPAAARRPSALRELVISLLATALGAAVALRVSTLVYADYWMWTVIGAGAGLFLGWAWIRFVERRH